MKAVILGSAAWQQPSLEGLPSATLHLSALTLQFVIAIMYHGTA